MKIRLTAAILAGKIASWFSRLRGHKGSSLPGLIARKICPGCLRDLSDQVRKEIILITGTNGKTTTTNMIAGILNCTGYKIIANLEGANMISGIATSFIMNTGIGGRIDCDYAVLEVDEASLPGVLEEVTPGPVVITNFFQDQLDRYWEIDKVVGIIRCSLSKYKSANLILNADDPLVAQFCNNTGLPVMFYGLNEYKQPVNHGIKSRETKICPFCGSVLAYDFYHYGHLGNYHCTGCQFKRPAPYVEAREPTSVDEFTVCRLHFGKQDVSLAVQLQGVYNLYNALAAFSAGLYLGIAPKTILDGLRNHRPVTGRMEKFVFGDKQVFLNLVKNPAGFNEGLSILCSTEGTKDVFIAINDNDADGKDISWLWDVDFEMLGMNHEPLLRLVCSGMRGEEMALRLKYAGIPVEKIVVDHDLHRAIKNVLNSRAGTTYLFSTYTALWHVHKITEQLASGEGVNA